MAETPTEGNKTSAEGISFKGGQTTGMGILYTFEWNHHSRRHYTFFFSYDNHDEFTLSSTRLVRNSETGAWEVEEYPVGTAQIYFDGPKTGYFKMNTEETGSFGFPLSALGLSQDPRSGPWIPLKPDSNEFDEASKRGYMLMYLPEGLTVIHNFWNHPSDEPWSGFYPPGNHTQEWEIGIVHPVTDEVSEAVMKRVINGQRDNPMPVKYQNIETITLRPQQDSILAGPDRLKQFPIA
jgi:hypothetical protein